MKLEFRGSDSSTCRDIIYDVPIYRYSSVAEIPWATFVQQPDQMVRIIVHSSEKSLPLDVLYQPRRHERLMIGFHGAEDQSLSDLPKFQFVKSFLIHREEALLFIADSTLLHDKRIRIGWLSGDESIDLAKEYAILTNSLIEKTGLVETILVGHSAGATAAIKVGSRIPNSHTIAVNGQLGAEFFYEHESTALREGAFPQIDSNQALFEKYKDRLDLREVLKTRATNSSFSWFTHEGDIRNSFELNPSYPKLVEHFNLGKNGGGSKSGDLIALCNWETGDVYPHALPGTVIPFINAVLNEECAFDIGAAMDQDLQWKGSIICANETKSDMTYHYRNINDNYDAIYDARIFRYPKIEDVKWLDFANNGKYRIIIQASSEELPIDVLFLPKNSKNLLVGFHGAEPRSLLDAPKFQFLASLSNRDESLLLVSDSTLLTGNSLNVGWLAGNRECHLGRKVADLINSLTESMNLHETILIGHSAGGFAAITVGAMVNDSHAISVNGQTAIRNYHKWAQENLRMDAFPDSIDIEAMLNTYKDRLDLREALRSRVKKSRFTLYAHQLDRSSFQEFENFTYLAEEFAIGSQGGITENGDRFIPCNWGLKNGNPHALPGVILPFIEHALAEECTFDIGAIEETRQASLHSRKEP